LHFPSKKHLYGEILHLGCEGDPALERPASLEPSTLTLGRMIHYMVRYFIEPGVADRGERDLIAALTPRPCTRSDRPRFAERRFRRIQNQNADAFGPFCNVI
jgi:hypothetical protein